MTVEIIGFKSFVKSAGNKHVTFTQFSIYREVHSAKELALELKDMPHDVIKIVNFIKSRALK